VRERKFLSVSRQRKEEIVLGRELLMVLGVERCNLQVRKLALQLARSSAGMSKALARGIQKKQTDDTFKKKLDELDQRIAREATKV